jgi:hypothetical protein
MLVTRSLGLYEIASLKNGTRSITLSLAVCLACGALNYLLAELGLLELPVQWLIGWIVLASIHLIITRGLTALWTRPFDRAEARLLQSSKGCGSCRRHPNQWSGLQAQIEPPGLYASRQTAAACGLRPAPHRLGVIRQIGDGQVARRGPHRAAVASPSLHGAPLRLDSKGPILFKQRRYGSTMSSSRSTNSAPCMPI